MNLPSFSRFEEQAFHDHLSPAFHNNELRTTIFQKSKPVRFGEVYRDSLSLSQYVRIVVHARVTEIEEDPSAAIVRSVRVATRSGQVHRIAARHFVLASGGLENPRLLLCSRGKSKTGIGNEYDLVGRYYMQHPKGRHGIAVLNRESPLSSLYTRGLLGNGARAVARVTFSDEFQRREQMPNPCVGLCPQCHCRV